MTTAPTAVAFGWIVENWIKSSSANRGWWRSIKTNRHAIRHLNPNTSQAATGKTVRVKTADMKSAVSTMMNIEDTGTDMDRVMGKGTESRGRNRSSGSFLILTRPLKHAG